LRAQEREEGAGDVLAHDLDERIALYLVVLPVELALGVERDGIPGAALAAGDDVVFARDFHPAERSEAGPPAGKFFHRLAAADPGIRAIALGGALIFLVPAFGNIPAIGSEASIHGRHHVADHVRLHSRDAGDSPTLLQPSLHGTRKKWQRLARPGLVRSLQGIPGQALHRHGRRTRAQMAL